MTLSDEGREKIREGQRKRWQGYYAERPTYPCGHERSAENTKTIKRTGRADTHQCRKCDIERSATYWAANKDRLNAERRARDAERRKANA